MTMQDTRSTEHGCRCEPDPTFPYRPRPKDRKRSPDLQWKSHIRELAELDGMAPVAASDPARRRGGRAIYLLDRGFNARPIERERADRVAFSIHRPIRRHRY